MKDYKKVGTPIITVEHLGDNKIIHHDLPLVGDDDKERLIRYILQEGDIVFSRVGSVDRRAYVTHKEDGWMFSGRCLRVRPNNIHINSRFLSFYFGQEKFKENIRKIAVGATMPSINTTILSEVTIFVPPLPTQTRIASILTSFDDKIELLGQMNQTLETMAQTIFKEWFVNFNFPGFDGELVEGLPKGWRMGRLEDLTDIKTGKGLKRSEFKIDGKYSVIGANGEIGKTDNFLFDDKFILTGRVGTLGTINISYGKHWYSDNVLIMKPFNYFYYTYFLLKMIDMKSLNRGSTQPLITQTDLKNYVSILPNAKLSSLFEEISFNIFEKIFSNIDQVRTLTHLRDALLPKLMSGTMSEHDLKDYKMDRIMNETITINTRLKN